MLASTPNDRTETQYMSEYFTYKDMYKDLSSQFNLALVWEKINTLLLHKAWLSDLYENELTVRMDPPYLISALQQADGNVIRLSTHPLSTAMRTAFSYTGNDGHDISTIIPSLNTKTHSTVATAANPKPYMNYITSIVDANGYIQRIEQFSLKDALADDSVIGESNAKVRSNQNYISAVYGKNGKIDHIGENALSNVVSKVRYKDYVAHPGLPGGPGPILFSDSDLLQLNIIKLNYSDFEMLSVAGRIEPNTIYMTINDPGNMGYIPSDVDIDLLEQRVTNIENILAGVSKRPIIVAD